MKLRHTPSRDEQQAFMDYGDRIADGDTAPPTSDLESTFLRVQRAMRADHRVPEQMPDHLRMRAWEDIMQNAAAIPTGRPAGNHGTQRQARSFPSVPLPRMAWTGAANIALALLVVIAGFGAWRAFDGGLGGGGNSPAPTEGRYAQAPMTPVPDPTEGANIPLTACDFSEEVPIYNRVDTPPVDGTVLYVTTSRNLMLHCDEEPQDILLSTDVNNAYASHWPGVVNLGIGADHRSQTPVFLNVMTNEWVEPGFIDSSLTMTANFTNESPFNISALPNDPSSWMLTDLRTMESRSLSELGNVQWPAYSSLFISENGAQGTYAISVFANAALQHPEGLPGEIMVVADTLDDVSWIDLPADFPNAYSFEVSPDGGHIAVLSVNESVTPRTAMISVISVGDGSEVVRTAEFLYGDFPTPVWVQDGTALAYLQDDALVTLDIAPGESPQVMLQTQEHLFSLTASNDTDVVTVSEAAVIEEGHDRVSDRVHAINTRTGTTKTFEGQLWQPGSYTGSVQKQPILVLLQPQNSDASSTRIIDPSTGTVLLEIPTAPTDARTPGVYDNGAMPDGLAVSRDGTTLSFTVQLQSIVVASVSSESPTAREIAFPKIEVPDKNWTPQVSLSPDGTTLLLSFYGNDGSQQWTLDLTAPNPAWVQEPTQGPIGFMPAVP